MGAEWTQIDDFQSHQPGVMAKGTGGWTCQKAEVTRISVAPVRDGAGNQALKIQRAEKVPSKERDLVWQADGIAIPPGKTGTVFLRFQIEAGMNELGNPIGDKPVQRISVHIGLAAGAFAGYNSAAGVVIEGTQAVCMGQGRIKDKTKPLAVKRNRWYRLWLVVDNRAGEENASVAYLQEEGVDEKPVQVPGVVMNAKNPLILTSIGIQKSPESQLTDMWIDDVYVDATGANLGDPLAGGKAATWQQRNAEEAKKYREFTRQTDDVAKAFAQARHLVAAMSPEERLALVCGNGSSGTPAIPRLGIEQVRFADASCGINAGWAKRNGHATIAHPATMLLAATWDPQVALAYGRSIGEECQTNSIHVLLGPGMNGYRHAVNGRNFEYMGEDPCLTSAMIAGYVTGMRQAGTGTTLKHFICNEMESHRRGTNSIVDERALHEIYLPAFQAGIDAGSIAVMTAYNQVNGEWAGESKYLNTTLLREQMGFTGVSMTDWIAAYDGVKLAASGTDLEMPGGPALMRDRAKVLGTPQIDGMATRVLATWIRAGFFEPGHFKPELEKNRPQWEQQARRTNHEGIVLLKNSGLLPLAAKPAGTVLVTGNALKKAELSGGGSGHVTGYDLVTYLEACQKRWPGATIVEAAKPTDEQIGKADLVLVFSTYGSEGEGVVRPFPLPDDELIGRCTRLNKQTIVTVATGGGAQMEWADAAAAVLYASYGGQTGAEALFDVLDGTASPSGRLPFTIERALADAPAGSATAPVANGATYPLEHIHGFCHGDFFKDKEKGVATVWDIRYDEGVLVGYRWYDAKKKAVRFPFGHGLGYTTFAYRDLSLQKTGADTVHCRFTVANTGKRAGAAVAQIYVGDDASSVIRPPKELKAFRKLRLEPGASQTVELDLGPEAFRFWKDGKWTIEPGRFTIHVGASSADLALSGGVSL
jgi:beta-glucosidase